MPEWNRESLMAHCRTKELQLESEIVAEVIDDAGNATYELDVLGWLYFNPLATWITIADPMDLPVGEYTVRARMMCVAQIYRKKPTHAITATFKRDGLAYAYAFQGQYQRRGFQPHTIPKYTP